MSDVTSAVDLKEPNYLLSSVTVGRPTRGCSCIGMSIDAHGDSSAVPGTVAPGGLPILSRIRLRSLEGAAPWSLVSPRPTLRWGTTSEAQYHSGYPNRLTVERTPLAVEGNGRLALNEQHQQNLTDVAMARGPKCAAAGFQYILDPSFPSNPRRRVGRRVRQLGPGSNEAAPNAAQREDLRPPQPVGSPPPPDSAVRPTPNAAMFARRCESDVRKSASSAPTDPPCSSLTTPASQSQEGCRTGEAWHFVKH